MTRFVRRHWVRGWMLVMPLVACAACCPRGAKPPPPVIRYLPTPATACLTLAPPTRPTLPVDDEPLATARLIDFAWSLDRWARYAWAVCS